MRAKRAGEVKFLCARRKAKTLDLGCFMPLEGLLPGLGMSAEMKTKYEFSAKSS